MAERAGGTTKICLTVCSGIPVYGATIQLWSTASNSSLLASCTTTTSGCCSFTQSGSYIVKVYVGGTLEYSATRTLNGAAITIALSAGANVVCCGGYAIPTTLTLTDAAGSLSFVYYPNYFYPIWYGGHSVSRLPARSRRRTTSAWPRRRARGPVKVCYQMICYAGTQPTFSIQRSWSWVYQQGTLTPIWYQDPSGFTTGQPCTTAPPASCGSPHTDTASFGANPLNDQSLRVVRHAGPRRGQLHERPRRRLGGDQLLIVLSVVRVFSFTDCRGPRNAPSPTADDRQRATGMPKLPLPGGLPRLAGLLRVGGRRPSG